MGSVFVILAKNMSNQKIILNKPLGLFGQEIKGKNNHNPKRLL